MNKKTNVLMISFHFPPIASSSGFLRSLKFARYLPKDKFKVTVLSATETAYETTDTKNRALLDNADFEVHRALALDASRQLSFKGKYFSFMTWPDKWSSWVLFGLIKGFMLVKRQKTDIIWVTYPIASALLIAYLLAKVTDKPLVVDLRDPIWEEETWENSRRQRILRWLERKVLGHAEKIVFTSPGTIEKYRTRYPTWIANKAELILNGFDEADFTHIQPNCEKRGKRIFLHSGLIPVYERNPICFFNAIAKLKQQGVLSPERHEFRLRACGNQLEYQTNVNMLGIDGLVSFPGPIPYKQALAEMLGADALMIFQDATCNWQIPAKLFEYLRSQKPILAWTEADGDTAALIKNMTEDYKLASLTDTAQIQQALDEFVAADNWQCTIKNVEPYTRENLAAQLAELLTDLTNTKSTVKR